MTVANGEVTREVPVMPGGQRVLGHALEFGRDPLALFQRAEAVARASGHDDPFHEAIAQLDRASDCGSEGRWFEST